MHHTGVVQSSAPHTELPKSLFVSYNHCILTLQSDNIYDVCFPRIEIFLFNGKHLLFKFPHRHTWLDPSSVTLPSSCTWGPVLSLTFATVLVLCRPPEPSFRPWVFFPLLSPAHMGPSSSYWANSLGVTTCHEKVIFYPPKYSPLCESLTWFSTTLFGESDPRKVWAGPLLSSADPCALWVSSARFHGTGGESAQHVSSLIVQVEVTRTSLLALLRPPSLKPQLLWLPFSSPSVGAPTHAASVFKAPCAQRDQNL